MQAAHTNATIFLLNMPRMILIIVSPQLTMNITYLICRLCHAENDKEVLEFKYHVLKSL